MADLFARFKLIDEMSSKLSQMASAGTNMLNSWQNAGHTVNNALAGIDKASDAAAKGVEDFSDAVSELDRSSSGVLSATEDLSSSMENLAQSAEGAAEKTDYWTDAIGNYDKSAMDAIYTTEELVEMGFKTQDALEAEAKAADQASEAAEELGDAAEDAGDQQEEMAEKGSNAAKTLSDALTAAGIVKLVHEIGKAFLEASEDAAHFETSIAQLQTIAGKGQIGTLTADINDLSRRTGIAASDLAGVAYNAISAGAAVEEAVGTAEAASKLATAGFTDTTSALSVLSTAMNSYGDAAGTAMDISNSLITVQNLGVTTVADLSQQIGRAIAVGAGYNVSLGNLEAAYISTTKAGINTAQSTTYISAMITELGKASSTVSEILVDKTGKSFGQLMQSGESLADILDILYDSVNGDTEAFMNLWGSSTAGMGAAAIINQGLQQFNENLNAVENAAGATEKAYSIMADTTEFAHQRMKNSMEQVSIAFGSQLNPAMEKAYSTGAKIMSGFAEFIENNPKAVKAITVVAVTLGTLVVSITAVTAAVNLAKLAIIPFFATLAANPLGITIAALAAVTAGIVAFSSMVEKAEDETLSMTYATRKQYYELQELQAEYEDACNVFGDTSEEASTLKYRLDDLSRSFEANRQTIDELADEVDGIVEKHNQLFETYDASTRAVKDEELANLALIAKLADMAASTDQTAESQAAMNAIIEELNSNIDGASLSYEQLMRNQEGSIRTLREYAKAQAEQERRQEKYREFIDLVKQQAEEEEALAKVNAEVEEATLANAAAQQKLSEAIQEAASEADFTGYRGVAQMYSPVGTAAAAAAEALDTVSGKQKELQDAFDETTRRIAELESEWDNLGQTQEDSIEVTMTYADAVGTALSSVQEDIDALCAAYDEAFESARSSIDGQIGLFETMKTETETSVSDMQAAFASQIEYLSTYTENLRKAAEYGLDEGLIKSLSDGSTESAGYIDAIIKNIEGLGAGTEDAQSFVQGFNEQFKKVEEAKDTFADTVAKMETDFDEKMSEIEGRLAESIEELNQEEYAAEAAKATIDAYIQAISDGADGAAAAARAVSAGVTASLRASLSSTFGIPASEIPPVQFNAQGTDYAADVFVAGEEGPELVLRNANAPAGEPPFFIAGQNGPEVIVGEQGAKVFTHEETERIFQQLDGAADIPRSEEINYGDSFSTVYTTAYDTDYAYDMSHAVDSSSEVSSVTSRDSHDTFASSYDRTYDTDYAYDMSRRAESTSEVLGAEGAVAAFSPDFLMWLFRQMQTPETAVSSDAAGGGLDAAASGAFGAPAIPDIPDVVFSGEDGAELGRRAAESPAAETERIFRQAGGITLTPLTEATSYGDTFNSSYANADDVAYSYDLSRAFTSAADNSTASSYDNSKTISESADTAFNTAYSYLWNQEPGEAGNPILSVSAILPDALRMLLERGERSIEDAAHPEDRGDRPESAGGPPSVFFAPGRDIPGGGEIRMPAGDTEPLSAALDRYDRKELSDTRFEVPEAPAFRTTETERMIENIRDLSVQTEGETESGKSSEDRTPGSRSTEDTKRIFLEISGAGAIEIGSRTDRDEVLEILQENIRPVLVGIIEQEIYEEGERSYEF